MTTETSNIEASNARILRLKALQEAFNSVNIFQHATAIHKDDASIGVEKFKMQTQSTALAMINAKFDLYDSIAAEYKAGQNAEGENLIGMGFVDNENDIHGAVHDMLVGISAIPTEVLSNAREGCDTIQNIISIFDKLTPEDRITLLEELKFFIKSDDVSGSDHEEKEEEDAIMRMLVAFGAMGTTKPAHEIFEMEDQKEQMQELVKLFKMLQLVNQVGQKEIAIVIDECIAFETGGSKFGTHYPKWVLNEAEMQLEIVAVLSNTLIHAEKLLSGNFNDAFLATNCAVELQKELESLSDEEQCNKISTLVSIAFSAARNLAIRNVSKFGVRSGEQVH